MDLSNDISKQEPYYSVCSNQVSEAVENLKFDSFKKSEYSNTEEGGDIYYTAEIVQNDFELKDAVVYIESEKIIQEAIIEHEPELYGVAENQVVSTSFSDRVETVEDVIEIADEEVGVKETFATSRCGTGSDVSELVDDMPTSKYLYGISVDSPISQNMETLVSESSDVLSLECEVVYDEFTVT
ncbi:hypothetical protein DPMN_011233 [Dreissena polymorpha]|uniref:Uncharacterized protein n=1 Tax=Dreissena polymorpha TaxID=45954 RepID=A0A9D4N5Q0_DREPO|nr:hypothetical protein DPMN_011233 [Dreissena polymorpha]